MLRNFSKNNVSKSNSSSIFSRLRSSLHTSNPISDRFNETQTRHKQSLKNSMKSSIVKSNSERKIKHILNNKQNQLHSRSNSVKSIIHPLPQIKPILNNKKQTEQNQDKDIKQKLNQQFKQCIKKLDHSKHIHIGQNQCFLDYKCFVFIMTEMNYLNLWKEDNLLLNQMWKDLGGENYGGFLKSNLLLFLEMIEGLTQIDITKQITSKQEIVQKKQKIFDKYEKFRCNKTNQSHTPLLKNNSISRLKQSIISDKKIQEKTCLKPIIKKKNQNKSKNLIHLKKKPENKKSEKVFRVCFQLDKVLSIKQPNNLIIQNDKQKQNQMISIIQKPEVNIKPKQQQFKSTRNIRVPLLSLDVNLGQGKTDKIIVYQSDTPRQIAQQLAIKHRLPKATCQKFQKILQNHLKHLLSKIEQVEQLTEDQSCSHRQI